MREKYQNLIHWKTNIKISSILKHKRLRTTRNDVIYASIASIAIQTQLFKLTNWFFTHESINSHLSYNLTRLQNSFRKFSLISRISMIVLTKTNQIDFFVTSFAKNSNFQKKMNSQFLMFQREIISRLNFAINVNQCLNQTIKNNNFRIHLSNEFENDQNKNQSHKTSFKIILKRSRRWEIDRRCTFIEQFVEIKKQKEFVLIIHFKNVWIEFSINILIKNAKKFQIDINERSQNWYDALKIFLNEHKTLIQLQKISQKSLNTFNCQLKKQRTHIQVVEIVLKRVKNKIERYKKARNTHKAHKQNFQKINKAFQQDIDDFNDVKVIFHKNVKTLKKKNVALKKEKRSLRARQSNIVNFEIIDFDRDANHHVDRRVDKHSKNSRDKKQYCNDRRRLVIDSYHN